MKKIILITGSSRGMGRATALLAAERGYRVILHGKTLSQNLHELQKQIPESEVVAFDMANAKETKEQLEELLNKIGYIDILVNNAGISSLRHISEVKDEEAIDDFRINVLGPMHCIQAIYPSMQERKSGVIINIASIKGILDLASMSSFTYSMTKAALISMTKSLAKDAAQYGIRVNAIAPGYIETDISKTWSEATWERAKSGALLKRLGKPEEVAKATMFLASDDASFIDGEVLMVDGGYKIANK